MSQANNGYAMTDEQKYLFDLNGYQVIPGVLSSEQCRILREFVVALTNDPASLPDHGRYAAIGDWRCTAPERAGYDPGADSRDRHPW